VTDSSLSQIDYEDAIRRLRRRKKPLAAAKTRMEKAVEDFGKELAHRTPRPRDAALLDNVRVDFYGTPTPVNQLGTVTVPGRPRCW